MTENIKLEILDETIYKNFILTLTEEFLKEAQAYEASGGLC